MWSSPCNDHPVHRRCSSSHLRPISADDFIGIWQWQLTATLRLSILTFPSFKSFSYKFVTFLIRDILTCVCFGICAIGWRKVEIACSHIRDTYSYWAIACECGIVFSRVWLWVCVCLFVNAITLEPFEISWHFYGSKIMTKSSDEFEMAAVRCSRVRCFIHRLISPMHQTCIRVFKSDASVKSTGE